MLGHFVTLSRMYSKVVGEGAILPVAHIMFKKMFSEIVSNDMLCTSKLNSCLPRNHILYELIRRLSL